ncbi:MAG: GntR family transcriptional regulator [Pirellulales bacterium]|nr:GntR family transcriptional regulator [Pirellulales bacterium]
MNESLSQKAYAHIHRRLVSGQMTPGSRLSNRALAKEIGISFTPVREALNRLVSEGLLEYQRGLGVFVPTVSRRQIEEIYELRETLECAAVVKVCQRASNETLEEVETALTAMGGIAQRLEPVESGHRNPELAEALRQADAAFHLALLRLAGNRLVLETVESLRARSALVPHRFDHEPIEAVQRNQRLHADILEAVRQRDAEAAQAAMSEHFLNGRQQALAAYDRGYMDRGRRQRTTGADAQPPRE